MKSVLTIFFILISVLLNSTPVDAHANLATSSPSNGAVLEQVPAQIVLTFNTKINKQVYQVDALDQQGESIAAGSPLLNPITNQITIQLPTVYHGVVQVPYSVLSKDGHPIEGSITFTVGVKEASISPTSSEKDPVTDELKPPNPKEFSETSVEHSPMTTKANQHSMKSLLPLELSSIIKSVYLVALLLITGSLLWRIKGFQFPYLVQMQLIHIILLVIFTWAQVQNFTHVFNDISLGDLFLGTEVGQLWTAALVISILGLYIIGRNRYLDFAWVFAILLANSLNSHAIASKVPILTVFLDFVHVLVASIWFAGLFYMLISWKSGLAKTFIPIFSKAALISILTLTITGSLYAVVLTPSITSLWTTAWGYWLIAKMIAVVGIFILGTFIRRHMNKNGALLTKNYIYFDAALGLMILFIVGLLNQLSSSS